MLAAAVARREGYAVAELLLQQCLELAPGYSAARYDLARLLLTQQKPTLLPPLIDRLLLLDSQNVAYRDLQATYLSFIGRHAQALELLTALVAELPDSEGAWINYGHELKAAGQQNESIDAYRKVIALAPTSGAAYWSLANLKTFRFETADVAEMRNALQRVDLRSDDRVGFEFALAKALEDDAQYCDSFAHYAAGNSLQRTAAAYDPHSSAHTDRKLEATLHPRVFRGAPRVGIAGDRSDFHRRAAALWIYAPLTDSRQPFARRRHARTRRHRGVGAATRRHQRGVGRRRVSRVDRIFRCPRLQRACRTISSGHSDLPQNRPTAICR